MEEKYQFFKTLLEKKYEQNRFKQLQYFQKDFGETITNFQTLDSLDLQSHPFVKKNTIKYILEFGIGSKQSNHFLTQQQIQQDIEEKLKILSGFSDSFFLQYDQNIHQYLLRFLGESRAVLFVDRGCSHHLIKAALDSHAKVVFYEHNNVEHLKELLAKESRVNSSLKIIVSESLFFDYGDLCYLKALSSLSDEYHALLYLDDSSSFGIMGENGLGFCSHKKGIDIVVSSFGKSFSSYGYFILCEPLLKEVLLELCSDLSSIRFLPPANLGAINAILDILPEMELERQKLQKNAQFLRRILKEKGFSIGGSTSHIIPIQMESKEEMNTLYEHLMSKKILCNFSSKEGKNPLIKLIVHAAHTKEELDHLVQSLLSWERPVAYKTL